MHDFRVSACPDSRAACYELLPRLMRAVATGDPATIVDALDGFDVQDALAAFLDTDRRLNMAVNRIGWLESELVKRGIPIPPRIHELMEEAEKEDKPLVSEASKQRSSKSYVKSRATGRSGRKTSKSGRRAK